MSDTQGTEKSATGSSGSKNSSNSCKPMVANPQDVLLASVTLALALTKGRSQYEVETLINLLSLTTDNLQAVLAQMLINKKGNDQLEAII
ncbi:MAG: hypothetical protein RR135_04830 [Oscillospiraceae bacterium]